jgi:hypothetical protein
MGRHKYFYETHNITSKYKTRKYRNYYEFLINDNTGFIGGKEISENKIILNAYDNAFLNNRPGCRHAIQIYKESEHFAISQIVVLCKDDI